MEIPGVLSTSKGGWVVSTLRRTLEEPIERVPHVSHDFYVAVRGDTDALRDETHEVS